MAFEVERQLQDLWCWAAVSASIRKYFRPASPIEQCGVAGAVLGNSCCDAPRACNRQASLTEALIKVEHFRDREDHELTFERIKEEINNGRPIGVRVVWTSGGGHFVAISGYREANGQGFVIVADPLFNKCMMRYEDFKVGYQNPEDPAGGSGRWTHSYLVQE